MLDQHSKLDFYSASSLKQQSTCRYVDHLNILFYYFSITKKCMTLMQGLSIFDFIFHMIFNVDDINTTSILIMVSSWSYGSWIYNYLCNQCLSPLTLWVWIPLRQVVLKTTLCDKVCQWLARQVGGFLRVLQFPPPIKLTATI